jgi:hypothetical protein
MRQAVLVSYRPRSAVLLLQEGELHPQVEMELVEVRVRRRRHELREVLGQRSGWDAGSVVVIA